MGYKFLKMRTEASVALLTLDRPPVNAISTDLLRELRDATAELAEREEVRAVVITGEGRAFVGGADIVEMRAMDAARAQAFAALGQAVFAQIEELQTPTLAAVNGYALGGGCELAMACDVRLASERAVFGQPEITLGVIPGFGGTQRLPRLVGLGKAKELLLTGATVDAEEALRIGLVERILAPERLLPEGLALAATMASKSAAAVRRVKQAVRRALEVDLRSGCELEAELLGQCFATEDQKEGMAAFLEKRAPRFQHR